jgi:hypothetical protein
LCLLVQPLRIQHLHISGIACRIRLARERERCARRLRMTRTSSTLAPSRRRLNRTDRVRAEVELSNEVMGDARPLNSARR